MSEYPLVVMRDEYTDGIACYVAYHPDLPGCMAPGDSVPQAVDGLNDVRPEWIDHLRRAGLAVPAPGSTQTVIDHDDGSQTMMVEIDRENLWGGEGKRA